MGLPHLHPPPGARPGGQPSLPDPRIKAIVLLSAANDMLKISEMARVRVPAHPGGGVGLAGQYEPAESPIPVSACAHARRLFRTCQLPGGHHWNQPPLLCRHLQRHDIVRGEGHPHHTRCLGGLLLSCRHSRGRVPGHHHPLYARVPEDKPARRGRLPAGADARLGADPRDACRVLRDGEAESEFDGDRGGESKPTATPATSISYCCRFPEI